MQLNTLTLRPKLNELPKYTRLCENNKILIETYQKKDKKSRFVTLDQNGKVQREIYLPDAEPGRVKMSPHATYCLANNKFYYLKENLDDEAWELHVERIQK